MTELQIAIEFLKRGIEVLFPYGDSSSYDFIIEYNNKFIRIQCKSSRLRKGCIEFNTELTCHNKQKNYSKDYAGKIDFFATLYNNEVYLISIEEAPKSKCNLRIENLENSNKLTKFAEDYHIDNIIKGE